MNTEITKQENPFGTSPAVIESGALVETESQRAIQEVQAAMVIAKKFPRNQMEAMDKIINACTRPTLAITALYSYPKGGTTVTGPSIRLAEAMAQAWGNMQFGIRELSASNGSSTVEAFAWDIESNTRQVKVFQVPHARYSKAGGLKKLTDPRDIYEMVANQGARRLRACILGVIPGDVTEAAVTQCEVTQAANIDTSPEAIKKMVKVFKDKFKVTEDMLKERIGKRLEAIDPAQMQALLNICHSINDGMSKPTDWFDTGEIEQTDKPAVSSLSKDLEKPSHTKKAKEQANVNTANEKQEGQTQGEKEA